MINKITLPVDLTVLPNKLNANNGYSAADVKFLFQDNEEEIRDTYNELVDILASIDGANNINSSNGATIEQRLASIDAGTTPILQTIQTDAVTHKTSNDHDSVYYAKAELDNGALDTRYYTEPELDNGQLDTRYYTETEVDGLAMAMELAVNQNAAAIVAVNDLIANLDDTYSTNIERITAINQVIADYEAADGDLATMIANKANTTDVYTKAQVDAMTLGSYKMDITSKYEVILAPKLEVDVNVAGFNADTDSISVYTGGVLMTLGVDWKYNVAKDKILKFDDSNWDAGITVDWLVIRNLRILLPSDEFEGALIKDSTVTRIKLASGLIAELDGLQSSVDANRADIIINQNTKAEIEKSVGTIPTTGWAANTGDNALKLDIALAGVLVTDWVDVVIDVDSHDVAGDAEINGTIVEYDGGITLYANIVPTVAIPFKWKVVR